MTRFFLVSNCNVSAYVVAEFSLNPGASTFESSDINALYLVLICLGVAFAIALGLLITVAIKKHLDRRNGLYFSSI